MISFLETSPIFTTSLKIYQCMIITRLHIEPNISSPLSTKASRRFTISTLDEEIDNQ